MTDLLGASWQVKLWFGLNLSVTAMMAGWLK